MNKKLDNKLGTEEITQTGNKTVEASPIGSASPRSRNKRSTIPLKKTVIILAVNPKTWLMVNKLRFLFIKFSNSDIANQETQNQDL